MGRRRWSNWGGGIGYIGRGGGRGLDKKKKRGGWIMRGLTLVIVVEVWG